MNMMTDKVFVANVERFIMSEWLLRGMSRRERALTIDVRIDQGEEGDPRGEWFGKVYMTPNMRNATEMMVFVKMLEGWCANDSGDWVADGNGEAWIIGDGDDPLSVGYDAEEGFWVWIRRATAIGVSVVTGKMKSGTEGKQFE